MGNYTTPAQTLQAERLRYPGMLPREIIIWRTWLRAHEKEYDRFDYNVRVGKGLDPGPQWPQNIRDMAVAISQKRIDAVGWRGVYPTIFEIKDRSGMSVVGQLIGYEALWPQSFPQTPAPKLVLVTNRLGPDLLPVLQKSGIAPVLVEADFSELASLYSGQRISAR